MKKTPIRSAIAYCDKEIKRMTFHKNTDQERNSDNAVVYWSGKIQQMVTMKNHLIDLLPIEKQFNEDAFNSAKEIADDSRTDIEKYYDDIVGCGNWDTRKYETFDEYFQVYEPKRKTSVINP